VSHKGKGIDLSLPLGEPERVALVARLRARTTVTPTSRSAEIGDCWVYAGTDRSGKGHAGISVHDRPVHAHRLSFAIHKGPIAAGVVVRHDCDNPPCWRPEHLRDGAQLDNVRDMWARGRAMKPPVLAGLANPNATLTDEQVAEIRALWATGKWKQRDIAARFGVSQSTVWRLAHGVTRRKEPAA
jgi:hypothetical protein